MKCICVGVFSGVFTATRQFGARGRVMFVHSSFGSVEQTKAVLRRMNSSVRCQFPPFRALIIFYAHISFQESPRAAVLSDSQGLFVRKGFVTITV